GPRERAHGKMMDEALASRGLDVLSQPLPAYTAFSLVAVVVFGALIRVVGLRAAWVPYRTWLIMLPLVLGALWLGPWAWALLVTAISIYGFKEFARATGLYRELLFVVVVYAAIAAMNASAYFGRFGLFMAAPLWGVAALTLVPILRNRTE